MFYDVGKRLIDIFGALVGIILFSPVMILIAIWIKIVSPKGPVFADMPKRSGKDSRLFHMFKFRSMVPNAQKLLEDDPVLYRKYQQQDYKLEAHEDPRIIRGGAFIRKTSIDEMPQFFNVLLGQMSIVGPRAYFPFELQEQAERFPEAKPYIEKLKKVKPGITGPWQVGGRNEVDFVERVKMDARYADNKSLIYDLLIIAKTPFAVLSFKGVI